MEQNELDTVYFNSVLKEIELEKERKRKEVHLACALKTHSNIFSEKEKYLEMFGKESLLRLISITVNVLSENELYEKCKDLIDIKNQIL